MSRGNGQSQPKLFNLNLESLLMSDESHNDPSDSQASSKYLNRFKNKDRRPSSTNRIKTIDSSVKKDVPNETEEDEGIWEFNEWSKFFENVGNDFDKSVKVRKTRLNQFTDAVISIYESKLAETVKRQECEVKELKQRALGNIQNELNKEEEEIKKLKFRENEIIKALEQQVKSIQKTATNLEALIENFNQVHKYFIQDYQNLKMKHRKETLELKKSLGTDMFTLQNKFLTESKKEEIHIVKKYLSTIYF